MDRRGVINPCVHKYREPPPDIGNTLAKLYKATLDEAIPDDMKRLLDKLK